MKLALARAMLLEAGLLLLDEPTNHMDTANVHWLQQYLLSCGTTLITVSHDSGFLDTVCTGIIHYENKKLAKYRGNLSAFVEQKPEAKAYYELTDEYVKFKFPIPGPLDGVKCAPSLLLHAWSVSMQPGLPRWGLLRHIFTAARTQVAREARNKVQEDDVPVRGRTKAAADERDAEGQHGRPRRRPRAQRRRQVDPHQGHHRCAPHPCRRPCLQHSVLPCEAAKPASGQAHLLAVEHSAEELRVALQPGLVLIAIRPLLLLFTARSMVCSVRMCVGEIKPTAGEIERHPNLRIAYIAQHAFHHLESHLMATPVQYIIRRYEHGEDEEEAEKVSDALPVLSLTTVTSLRLRLAHLMGWRVLITAGLECCVCCMQTACTAQCTW